MQTSSCYIDLKWYGSAETADEINERLITLLVTAEIAPSQTNYDDMIKACWNTLSSGITVISKQGYNPWLLLAGANLSFERRASYKNFSLSNALTKSGIEPLDAIKRDYMNMSKVRAVGLYKIRPTAIADSLVFLSKSSWALLMLTRRTYQELENDVDNIYKAADLSKTEYGLTLNWQKVAYENALFGDIIVRTFGSADDKYRSVVVVFSRKSDQSNIRDLFEQTEGVP